MRVLGVSIQFDDAPILDLRKQTAAPDAHLAHAGDGAIPFSIEMPCLARRLCHPGREHLPNRQCSCGGSAQF